MKSEHATTLLKPALLFLVHTLVQFLIVRELMQTLNLRGDQLPLPVNLENAKTLSDTLAGAFQEQSTGVALLLGTSQFWFQTWHLPMTTLNAILTGALMKNEL